MSLYPDASVLVALFVAESRSHDAQAALRGHVLVVSEFAVAGFSSAVARRARLGEITTAQASTVCATFDAWIARAVRHENIVAADLVAAIALVRGFEPGLRTPDAVNIAIAQRCGAGLMTLDAKMARSAKPRSSASVVRSCSPSVSRAAAARARW
ncbi:MAG: type II toxin-antitoxin system VapC family toxin [Gammaproteobacteria bacterium]|nr:type II toxin-antitoxin system VapC family toxin [Gammaproteobacteria bacterium]